MRLRPELLSLLVLLWALWAIAQRRFRLLGLLALIYTLSYTAFHAFLGLCVLIFVFQALARRDRQIQLLLYPSLGVGIGLIAHPHFPKNIEIWVLQSVEYFRRQGALDVGTEIQPNFTDVTLMVNLGFFISLIVLLLSTVERDRGDRDERATNRRAADAFAIAATAFTVLYLLMSRFSTYAFPLITLWVLYEIASRGRGIGSSTRVPWRGGRIPLALALLVPLLVGAPEARRQWQTYRSRIDAGPNDLRVRDREELAAALPTGAKVAATWRQTPVYMLWAPQAAYMNVLDPVFLAAHDPARHTLQNRVFTGEEPDVPLAVGTGLDSQYLAYSQYEGTEDLSARLATDSRVVQRHHGFNFLWEIVPEKNGSFLLDWRVVPHEVAEALDPAEAKRPLEPRSAIERNGWLPYPRSANPLGAALEGYVDTRRLGEDPGCVALSHELSSESEVTWRLELAPWGPSTAWLNGNLAVQVAGEPHAVLGEGTIFVANLIEGLNVLDVLTCPGKDPLGPRGFYLQRIG